MYLFLCITPDDKLVAFKSVILIPLPENPPVPVPAVIVRPNTFLFVPVSFTSPTNFVLAVIVPPYTALLVLAWFN